FDAGTFAGIVAWGVLFHLTLEDQADAFGRISTWLAPAGRLLFTSGGTRGSTIGEMDGVEFEYHSFDPEGYRRLLARSGLRLERHTVNAWGNHVYAAMKEG
ncbi:MAG: class I SAM-dependent methyltransferase, partial [Bacteroidota bacterium]